MESDKIEFLICEQKIEYARLICSIQLVGENADGKDIDPGWCAVAANPEFFSGLGMIRKVYEVDLLICPSASSCPAGAPDGSRGGWGVFLRASVGALC
jgi:hypothetical protein